ncbi:MAG: endonuclease III [Candidatus Nanohalobium sp.]
MGETEEEKIRRINRKLKEYYGEPDKPEEMSGVEYLIETVLSQNTNDINRDKAFRNLKEEYGDNWKKLEEDSTEHLADVIRVAGLGPTKAERIQRALEKTREHNRESSDHETQEDSYSIEFLESMELEEAKNWLTSIPGIGPKTASVILCFHFNKPTFPVDTHVHRVTKRLGLVPENASRKKTHRILEEKVPDDIKYEFHRLLIEHGRKHCKAQNPKCEEGPLGEECAPLKDNEE